MKNKKGYRIEVTKKRENFEEGIIYFENKIFLKKVSNSVYPINSLVYKLFVKNNEIIVLVRDFSLHESFLNLKSFAKCHKYDKFSFEKGKNIAISRLLSQIYGMSVKYLQEILDKNINMKSLNKDFLTKILYSEEL